MIKKVNKGYTLIELLLVIVLISLTFTIVYLSINTIINNSLKDKEEINKTLLLDAGEEYAMEYKNINGFSKYTSNGVTSFCISINTLYNYGIYNNSDVIKEYKDKYAIYVEGRNEVYNYDLIDLNDTDNKCVGVYFISELKDNINNKIINIHEKGNNNLDVGIIDLEYDLNITSNKRYTLNVNLKKYANIEHKDLTMPVYVVLVLDKSGSMWGDKYNNATNASIELSKSLINKFSDNAHIALVQFSTKSILKRGFESSILTNDDFDKATGSTYVSKGLSNANDLFSNLKNTLGDEYNNTLKYTILLYDGSPSDSSYEIKKEADILKDTYNSKLITIGYEFAGSNDLKEISSLDNNLCNNSNYLDYCYYESNSSDINSLFDEIQNNISLEVEKTKVSKVNVNMKLNSYLKADINGELLDNISYSIDLTENEEIEDYSYSIVVDDDIFNDCESKTCTKLIKLFDNVTISEYDKDNNLLSSNENKESVEFIITNNTYSTLH